MSSHSGQVAMAKVTYIGGPWDGKVEVATSFPPVAYIFKKLAMTATVKQITSPLPDPRHIYTLTKNGARYFYIYKGES